MQIRITFDVDTDKLDGYTDTYLAELWAISQANPAPFGDRDAGQFASEVGFEIIRRWLAENPPELYAHQARDHLSKLYHGKKMAHEVAT